MKLTMTFTQKEVEHIVAQEAAKRLKGLSTGIAKSWVIPGYEDRMTYTPSTYTIEVKVEVCDE